LVIYCHANGEDVGVLYEAGHWLCDTLGVHVLIPVPPHAPALFMPHSDIDLEHVRRQAGSRALAACAHTRQV
jgi:hypothetical protein